VELEDEIQEFLNALGDHIKSLREKNGISQRDLAGLADLDKRQIVRIENGQVNPKTRSVYLLAKAFKISISELFNFEDKLDHI